MNARDWEVLIWSWLLWGAWTLMLVGFLTKAIDLIGYGLREGTRWWQKILYRGMAFVGVPCVLPFVLTLLLVGVEKVYPIFHLTIPNDWSTFCTVWLPVYIVIIKIIGATSLAVVIMGADTFRMKTEESAIKAAWQTLLIPSLLLIPTVVKYVSVYMAGSVRR